MTAVVDGTRQCAAIGALQQFRFSVATVPPDRPHGVDHVLCLQSEAGGDDGAAGIAVTEDVAGVLQLPGSRGAEDGAAYAAACHQCFVGGVDDGVGVQIDNTGFSDFNGFHDDFSLQFSVYSYDFAEAEDMI